MTYQVPVLYFNAFRTGTLFVFGGDCDCNGTGRGSHVLLDGTLLLLDEVWGNLPQQFKNSEIRSTFLTQNVCNIYVLTIYIHNTRSFARVRAVGNNKTTNKHKPRV